MRPVRRGVLWVAAMSAAATVLVSCGSDGTKQAQAPPAATRIERLRLAGGDFGYPSPFGYARGPGQIQAGYMFDTLLWEDSTGRPIPWLANEWNHSADGLEWRFTVREGVRWHDGQPLTMDDVAFSFEYITTGAAAAASTAPRLELDGLRVEGNVLVLRLKQPNAVFEESIAERVFIIPKHVWADVADPAKFRDPKAFIGSGAYRMDSFDDVAGAYAYNANDDFFLGPPRVKRLEFVPSNDELLSLKRGDIHAAEILEEPVPPEQLSDFEQDARFGKIEGTGDWNLALHFNLAKGFPYDSKLFRQAVAYAVDRKDMVHRLLFDRGVPTPTGGLSPDHEMIARGLPTYDRDVAKAKAMLDEIGLKDTNGDGFRELADGRRFTQELQASTRFSPKSADLVKEYLRDVGIDVEVKILDRPTADDNATNGNYTMALVGYGGLGSDADALRTRFSSQVRTRTFSRAQGYVNRTFDDLANRQLVALDAASRTSIVQQMQQIVADELPILPLYTPNRTMFYVKAVSDTWYYTPGCSACRGTRNRHLFVTGKTTGV
jgi:peptide/nickel transport system substrate-binding protein